MRNASTAELTRDVPVAQDRGPVVFTETRAVPIVAFFGAPAVMLLVVSVAVPHLALRVICGLLGVVLAVVGYRRRRSSVIETYTVTTQYVMIEQPSGHRAAVTTDSIRGVETHGDRVRLDTDDGVLTLGFVRRKRALMEALTKVHPTLVATTRGDPLCKT
jgi:hypothetical protein